MVALPLFARILLNRLDREAALLHSRVIFAVCAFHGCAIASSVVARLSTKNRVQTNSYGLNHLERQLTGEEVRIVTLP